MPETSSLTDQVYSAIKNDILTCRLDPGSRIAQSQLVRRYAFGITPIREALKRLEQEGYVQSIPRFGYLIAPITVQDVEDLYDLRLILEQSAIRLAIQRASTEQAEQIRQSANFTYTFKDSASYLRFLEHNNHFHVGIALTSGNRKLAQLLADVLNEMTRIFNLGLDLRDSAEEMRGEHIALAEAIAARDIPRAEDVVRDQIQLSRQRVLEMLVQRLAQERMGAVNLAPLNAAGAGLRKDPQKSTDQEKQPQ
ncbi:MAG TPA: GntR family transcriptional regulator [Anaerolinea sp.]|nr:GntR family transcriptional regulator [Anaerolinea sp.]